MRDENQRQFHLSAQLEYEVQNLRLNRYIKRRDRFIGNDQFRLRSQCSRDRDALSLTAGELVRVTHHLLRRQPNLTH